MSDDVFKELVETIDRLPQAIMQSYLVDDKTMAALEFVCKLAKAAAEAGRKGKVLMPETPPDSIPGPKVDANGDPVARPFDDVLFKLCREDDYHGLYAEFIKRAGQKFSQ